MEKLITGPNLRKIGFHWCSGPNGVSYKRGGVEIWITKTPGFAPLKAEPANTDLAKIAKEIKRHLEAE